MSKPPELLIPTPQGLYCPAGDFHIDPWQSVARAVITHAHSDHVAFGCGSYFCSETGKDVLRTRLAAAAEDAPGQPKPPDIHPAGFSEPFDLGGVRLRLHPAGHILGSAQVALDHAGQRWVVSGDYKSGACDGTCEEFAPVPCDVFITESTFGLPIYRWPDERSVFAEINAWWRDNAAKDRTSIIFAYALGKAQRVLAGVDPSIGPLAVHGAVERFNQAYRAAGIKLPEAPHAQGIIDQVRGRGLIIAPPSALGSPWIRRFANSGGGASAAFVSGWMLVRGTRRRKAIDRGFVISDHADWPGLLDTIRATGAQRIGVTHGYVRPMVRWLQEHGLDAFPVPTRYIGEIGEEGVEPPAATPPLGPPDPAPPPTAGDER